MSNKKPESQKGVALQGGIFWKRQIIPCLVCAIIVGVFVWLTDPYSLFRSAGQGARDSYYNLLVQGFGEGHLYVKRDAPAALANLANPYDPIANAPYRANVTDLSYYKGKLYLYFGVTPALVLFWPYHTLTGAYLSEGIAMAVFFAIGFAALLGLVRSICRRCFPNSNIWMAMAYVLIIGLTMGLALLGSVNEVSITCGFMFAILTLTAIWQALHAQPKQQVWWLALASFAYGLAIASRPSLFFGAVVLLVPLIQVWREATPSSSRWRTLSLSTGAIGPIMLIGFGLMLYNYLRFNNPFEFGWHYQLLGDYCPTTQPQLSAHYFWFNFWLYYLEPIRLGVNFPFLQNAPLPPLPVGYDPPAVGGGILVNYPWILLAMAAPLAWRGRLAASDRRWFVVAIFSFFLVIALTLCFYCAAAERYKLDFLPELMLLSLIGFLGLEHFTLPSWLWVSLVRCGWFLLLIYSLIFNVMANVEGHAEAHFLGGNSFFNLSHFDEAMAEYQKAEALWPDCADAHYGLGNTLVKEGQGEAAIAEYRRAVEIAPGYAQAHSNFGDCLFQTGDMDDAIIQYQEAIKLDPKSAVFHEGLGVAFFKKGLLDDAIGQFQVALKIEPSSAEMWEALGYAFYEKGLLDEAIEPYRKAVDCDPTSVAYHGVLGDALFKKGLLDDAIVQYQEIIVLQPDMARADEKLGDAFQGQGHAAQAIAFYRKAMDLAKSQSNVELAKELQAKIDHYESDSIRRSTNN